MWYAKPNWRVAPKIHKIAIDNEDFHENIMVNVAKCGHDGNFVEEKGNDASKQGKKVYFLRQKRDF